jgi:hypothetical protein
MVSSNKGMMISWREQKMGMVMSTLIIFINLQSPDSGCYFSCLEVVSSCRTSVDFVLFDALYMFHRHWLAAAVAAGSNIYVFGRLNNDTILSSLHVLNTGKKALVYMVTSAFHTNRNKHLFGNNKIKFWNVGIHVLFVFAPHIDKKHHQPAFPDRADPKCYKEVSVNGEQPCARHSHSTVKHERSLTVSSVRSRLSSILSSPYILPDYFINYFIFGCTASAYTSKSLWHLFSEL